MSNKRINTIFVDADACPVVAEIEKLSKKHGVPVQYIASISHYSPSRTHWKFIDTGKDQVDFYIAKLLMQGDIVVTQDFGLAAIVLGKKAIAISPRGRIFTEDSMDELLFFRHVHAKDRRRTTKLPKIKPFTEEDRQHFTFQLDEILNGLKMDNPNDKM